MVDRLLQGSTALMHVFKGKKCLQKGGNDPIIIRAVCRIFSKGGQIWGTDKRGGAEAYVGCYTLHLLGGARMTQGGANAPPRPPLNTALN